MKLFKYLCAASILLGSLIFYECIIISNPLCINEEILTETQNDSELLIVQLVNDPVTVSYSHLNEQNFILKVNIEEGRDLNKISARIKPKTKL